MVQSYYSLTYVDLLVAVLLICAAIGASNLFGLGIGRRLGLAAARTTVQLLALGWVLHWVFGLDSWQAVLGYLAFMTAVAAVTAWRRVETKFGRVFCNLLASLWLPSWMILAVVLSAVVHVEPWYSPRYTIPIFGMILGNMLNGVTIGHERVGAELRANVGEIEAMLALGASRWEAAAIYVRRAVGAGMIPIINSMSIAGLVSLPGMMTGQILAGADPLEAVKYQILVMFLIGAATAFAAMTACLLAFRTYFSKFHRLQIS